MLLKFLLLLLLLTNPSLANDQNMGQTFTPVNWNGLATLFQDDRTIDPSNHLNDALGMPELPDLGRFTVATPPKAIKTPVRSNINRKNFDDAKKISISGYIIPLEYSSKTTGNSKNKKQTINLSEKVPTNEINNQSQNLISFFLVPEFGDILFDEPPSPKQVIFVHFEEPQYCADITLPYKASGALVAASVTRMGTTARYSMIGTALVPQNLGTNVEYRKK